MAKHYKAGEYGFETATPKNGRNFTLEELKGYVGGWIECVPLRSGRTLVVNDEGKLLGLPYNAGASLAALDACFIDIIAGDALLCEEGEML